MPALFVEKSIKIDAPASKVWEVLTDPDLSREWIRQWWPELMILESDWKPGGLMLWRLADGTIGAEGKVSAVEPPRMLRFSFQANDPTRPKQENLTCRLDEFDGRTKLSVSVGDFGDTPEHEACYPGAVEAWDRSLPKIKDLAER